MSVWPIPGSPCLAGVDGELVSITITTEPRLLEKLLDVLARIAFPINPQLYHDAATLSTSADGETVVRPVAVVEFPAWSGHLPLVKEVLLAAGFSEGCVSVRSMFAEMHSDLIEEPAPVGAPYKTIVRSKHLLRKSA